MKGKELLIRSLTGLLIVGITLAAIIYSPYSYLIFLGFIAMLGSWEFFKLEWGQTKPVILYFIPPLFTLVILTAGFYLFRNQNPLLLLIALPVLISFIVLIQLLSINASEELVKRGKSIYSAASYIVLPLLCGTLFLIGEYSFKHVLIPVILIWVNDVGAYLVGTRWGTKKILPSISPGKSLQGTIGGGVICLIAAYLLVMIWPEIHLPYILVLAIATPFFALAGDLWESALKRNAGVKDSGAILPGHGGILDRYDSFLFLLPVAAIAYYIFVL